MGYWHKWLLCNNGFGHVCLFHFILFYYLFIYSFIYLFIFCCGHDALFLKTLQQRLCDCFCQDWLSHLLVSYRFALNSSCKTSLQQEQYLDILHSLTFTFTYPLTVGITSRPISHIFLCSPLPSGTWRTPGLSIPWYCLLTSFRVCLVFHHATNRFHVV